MSRQPGVQVVQARVQTALRGVRAVHADLHDHLEVVDGFAEFREFVA